LIGEELLSGKVVDENARYLTVELRAIGVVTKRIEVIPDAAEEIADSVRSMSQRFDYLFTSGGVGATHDDVTMVGVAQAFNRPIERHEGMEEFVRASMGAHFSERDLRMADLPRGAQLQGSPNKNTWPVVTVENVFIFPGVPSILQRKFELVRERIRSNPIHTRALYCDASEGQIADDLDAIVQAYPQVALGSYPHIHAVGYKVKLTLDSRDKTAIRLAEDELRQRFGSVIVRAE